MLKIIKFEDFQYVYKIWIEDDGGIPDKNRLVVSCLLPIIPAGNELPMPVDKSLSQLGEGLPLNAVFYDKLIKGIYKGTRYDDHP